MIDVFLLGDLLLNTRLAWLKGADRRLCEHLLALGTANGGSQCLGLEEDLIRNWAVAALLHDIGYQFKWLQDLAGDPPPWHRYFRLPCPCADPKLTPTLHDENGDTFLEELAKTIRVGTRDEQCNKDETVFGVPLAPGTLNDHGVLSALRLAQLARNFDLLETDERPQRLLDRICVPLRAIALHNIAGAHLRLSREPLACLLRLCDEMQEWGRARVNPAKALLNIYLDIVDIPAAGREAMVLNQALETAYVNIRFQRTKNGLDIRREANSNDRFDFRLHYVDPTVGGYDATLTLLSKAYALQHVDLHSDREGHKDLSWAVELVFPRPDAYRRRHLQEYDFYGEFAEKSGLLPFLHTFETADEAREAGLVRVRGEKDGAGHVDDGSRQRSGVNSAGREEQSATSRPGSDQRQVDEDRFVIVVAQRSTPLHRHGWLSVDPSSLVARFTDYKNRLLGGVTQTSAWE